jgi:hypothetical protein
VEKLNKLASPIATFPIHNHAHDELLACLETMTMPNSKREAVVGKGMCVGLTNGRQGGYLVVAPQAFAAIRAARRMGESIAALDHLSWTSLQINLDPESD